MSKPKRILRSRQSEAPAKVKAPVRKAPARKASAKKTAARTIRKKAAKSE